MRSPGVRVLCADSLVDESAPGEEWRADIVTGYRAYGQDSVGDWWKVRVGNDHLHISNDDGHHPYISNEAWPMVITTMIHGFTIQRLKSAFLCAQVNIVDTREKSKNLGGCAPIWLLQKSRSAFSGSVQTDWLWLLSIGPSPFLGQAALRIDANPALPCALLVSAFFGSVSIDRATS